VVESVGEHVQEAAVGDTVVPVFLAQCGECADCRSARSNLCSALPTRPGMPRDGTTRFSLAATGEPVHNFLSSTSRTSSGSATPSRRRRRACSAAASPPVRIVLIVY
jgi:Zn-dependent alcohol dehydrogenase